MGEQLMIINAIALPGYFVALALMDKLGRKNMQLSGFLIMGASFILIGIFFDNLQEDSILLLMLYSMTFFFSNFGPNSTTFILPSEMFPFEVRTTMNGISAAMGKLGATLGGALFKPLASEKGIAFVMIVCGCISFIGMVVTAIFIEDMRGKSLVGARMPRGKMYGQGP